jgi:glycine cleavage system H lipoate-binding protein
MLFLVVHFAVMAWKLHLVAPEGGNRTMKCPFLEEIVVRYCKAHPVRKMIPAESATSSCPCLDGEYETCPAFKEAAHIDDQVAQSPHTMKEEERTMAQVTDTKAASDEKEKQCIWMKAGVVAYRMCNLNYDCESCEFNQSLMDSGGQYAEQPGMADAFSKLMELSGRERKCRYALMGEVPFKLCSHNYQCGTCEYDQMMQDAIDRNPLLARRRARAQKQTVQGFVMRRGLRYHPRHTWVRVEKDGTVRIGIDDFAQRIVGDIREIELPQEGEVVKRDTRAIRLKLSGDRMAELPVPMSGRIVERNSEVLSETSRLSSDPYDNWILQIQPDDPEEDLASLISGWTESKNWLSDEVDRLRSHVEASMGVTIADGGQLVENIHSEISDEEWRQMVADFFGA